MSITLIKVGQRYKFQKFVAEILEINPNSLRVRYQIIFSLDQHYKCREIYLSHQLLACSPPQLGEWKYLPNQDKINEI